MTRKLDMELPIASTVWPATTSTVSASSIWRAPNRSTSSPPKNGSTMLGVEYTVYSRLCVSGQIAFVQYDPLMKENMVIKRSIRALRTDNRQQEREKGYKQHFKLILLQLGAEMLLQLVLERSGAVVAVVGAERQCAAEQEHDALE